jgi:hypothetical protein
LGTKWKENNNWPLGHRGCKKCGVVKPLTAFHKHKQCWGGYNSVCKECRLPVSKENYSKHSREYNIWHRAKTRAVKFHLEFDIEISDIYIPEVCPIFNTPFITGDTDLTPSIDRIDPTKGYIKGNIMIISNKANRIKSNGTYEDIMQVAKFLAGSCEI